MHKNLRKYFPVIKTREEICSVITNDHKLRRKFQKWNKKQQNDFLDFCSGAKGVKVLYDSFFKEVLNPEYASERLNWLLSVILGVKVRIIKVLPTDSTRMGDETSLVSMDIVVELEDGSVVNVEIQKIGYLFPGQRSACYSADLLLRQYRRVRSFCNENNLEFKYSDIKPVYTIVFFEKSPAEFKEFSNNYIHRVKPVADTGIDLELLQEYIFISLDIFAEVSQNKSIEDELVAWLTFLSSDNVEDIIRLIEVYPDFKPIYETLYQMCENIEGVMNMFSEELYQLDRNTAKFMVDEYSRMVEEQKALLVAQKKQIEENESIIAEGKSVIAEKEIVIAEKENVIAEKETVIAEKDNVIIEQKNALAQKDELIAKLLQQLEEKENV